MMAPTEKSLPAGWTWASLGDLIRVIRGVTYKKEDAQSLPSEGYVPILRATNIEAQLTFDDLVFVPQRYVSEDQYLRPGDVVLAASSGSKRVVGKAAPLCHQWPGSFGAFCFALRPYSSLTAPYLALFLQSTEYRNKISQQAAGININNIRAADLESIAVPMAPVAEQERIVATADEQLTRLSFGVATLQRVQANLNRYRAAILKAAYEGRLVPTEARLAREEGREYESAPDLLARIGRANSSSQGDDIPEGWCIATIGDLFYVSVGATPSRSKPEFWNGEVPWVSSGEVAFCRIRATREHISQAGLEKSSTEIHPLGTVLLAMIGEGKTRGQAAILDVAASNNQNSAAIRVSETEIVPDYIYYFFWSEYEKTRRLGSGNNQPALNKSRVKVIEVPVAPVAEQKRIVQELESRLTLVSVLKRTVEASLKRAETLRAAILSQAFSGKLVHQDPNDEPASILLEKIRQERALWRNPSVGPS